MLTALLWAPSHLAQTGLVEEWVNFETLREGGSLIPPGPQQQLVRPLLKLPIVLAYHLTPDSFAGLRLLAAVLFLIKGAALFAILRLLGSGRALAFLAAALAIVYPADAALFASRAMGKHFSLPLFLVAVYALLRLARDGRWLHGALLVAAQILALGSSEMTLPLAAVAPALLAALPRLRRGRVAATLATWYAVPSVAALRLALALHPGSISYQRRKLAIDGPGELLASLGTAYRRVLIDIWPRGLHELTGGAAGTAALLGGLLAAAMVLVLARRETTPCPGPRRLAVLAAGGLAVIGVGFSPFLPTVLRRLDYTTLLVASLGGAVVVTTACAATSCLASRHGRAVFAALGALAVTVASGGALTQHRAYAAWSRAQQRVLRDMVAASGGGFAPGTVVLLISGAARTEPGWEFRPGRPFYPPLAFTASSRFVFADSSLEARLCLPFQEDEPRWWHDRCRLDGSGVSLESIRAGELEVPWEGVVAFALQADGGARLLAEIPDRFLGPAHAARGYRPERRLSPSPRIRRRARRLLPDPTPVGEGAPSLAPAARRRDPAAGEAPRARPSPPVGRVWAQSTPSTARKASCGMSTRPTRFIRRLPSFCFSSSLRLRVMSPP